MIETRHGKPVLGPAQPDPGAALKAMTVKTDKNDARGMAQLMRIGWFRPLHAKPVLGPAQPDPGAPMVQEVRALLTARIAGLGDAPAPVSRASGASARGRAPSRIMNHSLHQ
ncbi:MAG: hypothetical protein ACREJ5_02525 [Geminicoccaceae bacterium]